MLSIRASIALFFGKMCYRLLRMAGRHASTLPGLVTEKMAPNILGILSVGMTKDIIVVTGTNGKTSTTKIIKELLDTKGKCISNDSGSNFTRGIITTLMINASLRGCVDADFIVLEVDEAYAPAVCEALRPKVLLALNIFRDQLDRYGEIETTAGFIQKSAVFCTTLITNSNDDMLMNKTSDLVDRRQLFGTTEQLLQQITNEASMYNNGLLKSGGHESSDVTLTTYKFNHDLNKSIFSYRHAGGEAKSVSWSIHGIHNALNAVAAILSIQKLVELDEKVIQKTLDNMKPAYGRGESFVADGKTIVLNLVKNPSGFNQNLDTYMSSGEPVTVGIFINDNYADGRDVSWLWDINLSKLKQHDGRVSVGGIRKYDAALCLELNSIKFNILEKETISEQFNELMNSSRDDRLIIYATYTSMLVVRDCLLERAKEG